VIVHLDPEKLEEQTFSRASDSKRLTKEDTFLVRSTLGKDGRSATQLPAGNGAFAGPRYLSRVFIDS